MHLSINRSIPTLHCVWSHRYDVAMDINTVGPFRIMSFAQRFRRLKLFLQVSTGRSSENDVRYLR
jgi:hypothetical protein